MKCECCGGTIGLDTPNMVVCLDCVNDDLVYLRSKLADTEANLAALRELLADIQQCPYTIDDASVPSSGIENAKYPDQIVGMLSMRLPLYRKLYGLQLPEPPEDA